MLGGDMKGFGIWAIIMSTISISVSLGLLGFGVWVVVQVMKHYGII